VKEKLIIYKWYWKRKKENERERGGGEKRLPVVCGVVSDGMGLSQCR
jgi:hypothetical protein